MNKGQLPDPVELGRLFQSGLSLPISQVSPLRSHASQRRMFRLHIAGGPSYIGVYNPHAAENRAFVAFSRTFRELGLPVPQIHHFDETHHVYIEDDLGDSTLYDLLIRTRSPGQPFPAQIRAHYRRALELLTRFQVDAAASIDYGLCYQGRQFDRAAMVRDMVFFLDEFVERHHVHYQREELLEAFDTFAGYLCDQQGSFFMYRDFQARNIMVCDGSLHFIDYQSGRRGPLQYDVVSLLYQSQARIPEDVRAELLEHYLDRLSQRIRVDHRRFRALFDGFVFLRLMQVLGTYGKLGMGGRKEYFLRGVPVALATLQYCLEHERFPLRCATLTGLFERLIGAAPSAGSG